MHALLEAKIDFQVAHANFQLRGEESEKDQETLEEACKSLGLNFVCKRFDTLGAVTEHKESIQMAARRLRYDWLEKLLLETGAARIITAHHQRDQAETILLNLMRGTGVQGLQGMLPDNGMVWRPLLHMEYRDILEEADARGMIFREDASNADVKYKRNFIRHVLLEPWEERYPGTQRQLARSAELVKESNTFLQEQLEKELAGYCSSEDAGKMKIDLSLSQHPHARILMRHVLAPFGLQNDVPFILEKVSGPGALFASSTHRLLVDRDHYLIEPLQEKVLNKLKLAPGEAVKLGSYSVSLGTKTNVDQVIPDGLSVWIPVEMTLPLMLRSWQQGDKMQPFGMKGSKLLSDLFTDAKWSVFQKEKTLVITDHNGQIIAVPELRNAEALRVESGQQAYLLTINKHE